MGRPLLTQTKTFWVENEMESGWFAFLFLKRIFFFFKLNKSCKVSSVMFTLWLFREFFSEMLCLGEKKRIVQSLNTFIHQEIYSKNYSQEPGSWWWHVFLLVSVDLWINYLSWTLLKPDDVEDNFTPTVQIMLLIMSKQTLRLVPILF